MEGGSAPAPEGPATTDVLPRGHRTGGALGELVLDQVLTGIRRRDVLGRPADADRDAARYGDGITIGTEKAALAERSAGWR